MARDNRVAPHWQGQCERQTLQRTTKKKTAVPVGEGTRVPEGMCQRHRLQRRREIGQTDSAHDLCVTSCAEEATSGQVQNWRAVKTSRGYVYLREMT